MAIWHLSPRPQLVRRTKLDELYDNDETRNVHDIPADAMTDEACRGRALRENRSWGFPLVRGLECGAGGRSARTHLNLSHRNLGGPTNW